mgnify:CR=1 FL=1
MNSYSRRQFVGRLTGALATGTITQRAAAQDTPVVEMGNNYFDPIGLHVETGTTVRFEIAAGAHSATAYENRIPTAATPFDSGVISSGRYEHTFEVPGTYDYYCIPHKGVGMVGRIVVDTPGGPAEASQIPDGEVPASQTITDQGAVAYGSDTERAGSGDGGMMGQGRGGGHGMMTGPGTWGWGAPVIGGALGLLGLAGGLAYLTNRDSEPSTAPDDAAMNALKSRHERGEIDDAEFQRRKERLEEDGKA